ncbi:MAG: hypothetical protein N2037_03390 [Acidimicrobiales bacterium]|nr:hypothetical protein [Acidimicrobiales bacterium]
MSPVKPTTISPRTLALVAVSGVIAAVGLLIIVLISVPRLSESGQIEVKLGSDKFDAGNKQARAESIASGGPLLFSDVAGGQRDIILQHLGDDPDIGWFAFEARRPGQNRECFLRWSADRQEFEDPCDGGAVPADGAGLVQFPVEISNKGHVIIDLNPERRRVGTTSTTIEVTGSVPS